MRLRLRQGCVRISGQRLGESRTVHINNRAGVTAFGQRTGALGIGQHQMARHRLNAVAHFLRRAAAVDERRHRVQRGDGNEADHPLHPVAHVDGNPVTRLDAMFRAQQCGQRRRLSAALRIADTAVLLHDEQAVAKRGHAGEECPQRISGLRKHRHGMPAHGLLVNLERSPRRGEIQFGRILGSNC